MHLGIITYFDPLKLGLIEITAKNRATPNFVAFFQLQVGLQANVAQPHDLYEEDDDVDAALSELQISLEGSTSPNGINDITQVPQLSDYLRFFKPKRFTLKSFKSLFFVCRDLILTAYKTSDAAARGIDPVLQVNLKGCEVTPEVNLAQNKYQIKLEIPSAEGMSEMWLRFDTVSIFFHMCLCTSAGKNCK